MNDEILVKCFMDGYLFNSKKPLDEYAAEEIKAYARNYVKRYSFIRGRSYQ